jgi:hypothetical protein
MVSNTNGWSATWRPLSEDFWLERRGFEDVSTAMMEVLVPRIQEKCRWLQKGNLERYVRGRQLVDIEKMELELYRLRRCCLKSPNKSTTVQYCIAVHGPLLFWRVWLLRFQQPSFTIDKLK